MTRPQGWIVNVANVVPRVVVRFTPPPHDSLNPQMALGLSGKCGESALRPNGQQSKGVEQRPQFVCCVVEDGATGISRHSVGPGWICIEIKGEFALP